jgi:hypothetical protein
MSYDICYWDADESVPGTDADIVDVTTFASISG